MATIAEALQIAFDYHQTGRFEEAEILYGRILDADPDQSQALHLFGLLVAQLGRLDEAAALLHRAVAAEPLTAEPHANRGKVLRALGRPADAVLCFRIAATLSPDLWEAWEGLGHAGREMGDPAASSAGFGRAATGGQSAANHFHWALALEAAGRPTDAVPVLERAALLDPLAGAVPTRLAALLDRLGEPARAAGWYRRALVLRPDHADAAYNLAIVERSLDRLEASATAFARAANLQPGSPETVRQLAGTLLALAHQRRGARLTEAAVGPLTRAARLVPDDLEVQESLALTLFELGRFERAVPAYRRVVALAPSSLAGHYNGALAAKTLGDIAAAVAGLRIARHLSDEPWVHSTLLTTLLLLPGLDNRALDREISGWRDRFGRTRPHAPHVRPAGGRALKVGYVSGYLHPGNRLLAQIGPLLRAHDRSKVRPYVYGDAPYDAPLQDPVRSWADGWVDTRTLSDEALAGRIRADGIDVLVCLLGHTRGERMTLFTHRPAPIQASFHGMMATGVEAMDLWLTDPVLHPPDTTERFSERLVRLPHFFLFEPPTDAPPVAPAPVAQRRSVSFGSFNLDAKINERVVAVWARILAEVPNSRLVLKSRGAGLADTAGRDRMTAAFARHGLDPARLVLVPPVASHEEHLRLHGMIDVALDPFPYGGCLTSFDALSMGVPVVTLAGDRFIGRMTASLLHSAGLGRWVAASEEDYVAKAKSLAENEHCLMSIRMTLREQVIHSPLCDALSYSRTIEAAWRSEL